MEEIIISIYNYLTVSKVKHLILQHLNITHINHVSYTQEYFFLLFMTYDLCIGKVTLEMWTVTLFKI